MQYTFVIFNTYIKTLNYFSVFCRVQILPVLLQKILLATVFKVDVRKSNFISLLLFPLSISFISLNRKHYAK